MFDVMNEMRPVMHVDKLALAFPYDARDLMQFDETKLFNPQC
jgi:hypothetical protein